MRRVLNRFGGRGLAAEIAGVELCSRSNLKYSYDLVEKAPSIVPAGQTLQIENFLGQTSSASDCTGTHSTTATRTTSSIGCAAIHAAGNGS